MGRIRTHISRLVAFHPDHYSPSFMDPYVLSQMRKLKCVVIKLGEGKKRKRTKIRRIYKFCLNTGEYAICIAGLEGCTPVTSSLN